MSDSDDHDLFDPARFDDPTLDPEVVWWRAQDIWLRMGVKGGFCSPPVCSMHDGVPFSEDEESDLDEGDDPCFVVVRIYLTQEQRREVEKNNPSLILHPPPEPTSETSPEPSPEPPARPPKPWSKWPSMRHSPRGQN